MTTKKYSHVIWDWNGTLLDDVQWCINQINIMLCKRNKKTLNDVMEYHVAFCFPIIKYYKNVGFNFDEEPFETLAKEYIELYHGTDSNGIQLYKDAKQVLETIRCIGISQIILSASAQDNLNMQIAPFNIKHYFDKVLGVSNIYANSKIDIGLKYLINNNVQNSIVIGDTEHDYEVSKALGADCVLIAQGHQSREKLESCNVPVVENLSEILNYIC